MAYKIKNFRAWVGAVTLYMGMCAPSQASLIEFQVGVNISTAYDYVKSQYVPITPFMGTLNFTFDSVGAPRDCSPSSCPNQTVFDTAISSSSSLSSLIPSNFGSGTGSPTVIYAPDFNTDRYLGVFDWANAGTTLFDTASGEYLSHTIYVTILKLASYTTTFGSAESFLLDALANPSSYQVIAGQGWYASPSAMPTSGDFTQGYDWRDTNAVLMRVNDQTVSSPSFAVPEPSSTKMVGLGLLALVLFRLLHRHRQGIVRFDRLNPNGVSDFKGQVNNEANLKVSFLP